MRFSFAIVMAVAAAVAPAVTHAQHASMPIVVAPVRPAYAGLPAVSDIPAPRPVELAPHASGPVSIEDELRAMSAYAEVGALVGLAGGLAYGFATRSDGDHGRFLRGANIALDALVGAAIGLSAGTLVYVVRRAAGQAAPDVREPTLGR